MGMQIVKDYQVGVSKIVCAGDPLCNQPILSKAVRSEYKVLFEKETFAVVLKEDILSDGNRHTGLFLVTVKSTEKGNPKFKTRFVVGRHREKLKNLVANSSQTLQPSSISLILGVAAAHEFDD